MSDDRKSARVDQTKETFSKSVEQRAEVRKTAMENPARPWIAELDTARRDRFERRRGGAEAVQGSSVDFQPIAFLSEGARVSDAIAYVAAPGSAGSGFMISPCLFITNQHVLATKEDAAGGVIEFHYQDDQDGQRLGTTRFRLAPELFFVSSPEVGGLDYTVVAVGERMSGETDLRDFHYCPISDRDDKHARGMPVNIIQHPQQRPKAVVLRNNLLTMTTDEALLYETDSDVGSSGSPVFNDAWDVIALHHYGEPFVAKVGGLEIPTHANEGIRTSAIVADLRKRRDQLPEAQRVRLDEALALGVPGKPVAPRRIVLRHEGESSRTTVEGGKNMGPSQRFSADGQALTVTIPIEVTVRVGGAFPPVSGAVSEIERAPVVRRASEKVIIDTNYSNREGYSERFLGAGLSVPMPTPTASLVAPLVSGPNAQAGELLYEHFSVKVHRTRRFALFTATNIDGESYLTIDRKTGLPAQEASEKWYPDPRIDDKYLILQPFYSEWSTYFDRGHLTRRTDPNWGDEDSAVRANGDTYHFPNCSPQHFRFNESAKYWQGVERYVLENGAIANNKKLNVFQGPVLNGDYAECEFEDDGATRTVRVPLEFWKVVVWEGAAGLRASGFRVSQEPLLSESRKPVPVGGHVDVSEYRASIASIETLTGLKFADKVKSADTFPDDVAIGAEARKPIRDWKQLL